MKWLDRLLSALRPRKPQPLRAAAIEPEAMAGPDWKDGDTLPFVHRQAVVVPLSQIPVISRRAPHQLRAVTGGRADNAMGDPWVPPGPYGAAAAQVEGGEAPAPAFKSGSGGAFGGGGAAASWGSSDSGCSSGSSCGDCGSDGGSSGGCGGSD